MPLDFIQPPPPRPRPRYARPLIALAVSLCVAAVTLLSGLISLCGPNSHHDLDGSKPDYLLAALLITLGISVLSALVCFVWFIVALIRKSGE